MTAAQRDEAADLQDYQITWVSVTVAKSWALVTDSGDRDQKVVSVSPEGWRPYARDGKRMTQIQVVRRGVHTGRTDRSCTSATTFNALECEHAILTLTALNIHTQRLFLQIRHTWSSPTRFDIRAIFKSFFSQHFPSRKVLIALTSIITAVGVILAANRVLRDSGRSTVFGIATNLVNDSAAQQAAQLAAMKSIGITSVRVDANWNWVQPNGPATFDWTKLDQEVKSISAAGMSADLIIDGCPPWAAVPDAHQDQFAQPASSAQYATWAADVAKRYDAEGVKYFEIWNEPNVIQFWKPNPNPAAYTADLVAAYAAIKKVDQTAFVISGGLAPSATDGINYNPVTFLEAMYADGAKGSFDALGYHPYSFPVLPDTYESGSAWSQMAGTNPSVRSVMAKNGDSSKQIWITEFGAPSIGPSGIGPIRQRSELSQALAYVKRMKWIGGFFIYTWRDSSTNTDSGYGFGLLTTNGSPKPAFSAVASALAKRGLLDVTLPGSERRP